MTPVCVVCDKPLESGQWFSYHHRLNVWVHGKCPTTNVCGEDISLHTVTVGIWEDV